MRGVALTIYHELLVVEAVTVILGLQTKFEGVDVGMAGPHAVGVV